MRRWPNLDFNLIDDPIPRDDPDVPSQFEWPIGSQSLCKAIAPPPARSFEAVLEARRSERSIEPASLDRVVNAIAFATRPRFRKENDAFARTRRPSASAGSLHPIDVVLVPGRSDARLLRYNAMTHCLEVLAVEPHLLLAWLDRCSELLPDAHGTAIVFVADHVRVSGAYNYPASLIWRDAGALLQTLATVSTAFDLAFCPLGLIGNEIVGGLSAQGRLAGVGSAMIGAPTH